MFELPALPFSVSALEPLMSAATLRTHHGKHHAAYVEKTNAALGDDAPRRTVEEVVRASASCDRKLFNNAAQAWNHGFFWQSLAAASDVGEAPRLRAAIEQHFASLDAFRTAAKARGEGHFASGWLWLVAEDGGALSLRDTHDADTPILDAGVTPLFTCDLWEHAYYLDYQNARGRFLEAFLHKLVNWRFAEAQYAAACSGKAGGWVYPG